MISLVLRRSMRPPAISRYATVSPRCVGFRAPLALRPFSTPSSSSPSSPPSSSGSDTSSTPPAAPKSSSSAGSSSPTVDPLFTSRLKALLLSAAAIASVYLIYLYTTDTRATIHRWLVPPLLRQLFPDAEDAHHAGTAALKLLYALGLHPRERRLAGDGVELSMSLFGTTLANPIAISAGLDKDAEIPDALFALGPSIVEVGGCTPLPQEGNPRPRVFRVPSVDGMINRYGLNSEGADTMATKLRDRRCKLVRAMGLSDQDVVDGAAGDDLPRGSLMSGRLLLVQVAKNKATDGRDVDAVIRDYVYCVDRLAPYADVLIVNVSSPNTPGLRDLQATEPLTRILGAVVEAAQRTARTPKQTPRIMVKVSPDEDDDAQIEGVAQAVWASGVDGVIVGNTTNRRSSLVSAGARIPRKDMDAISETGGFSGPPMFTRTLDLVRRYRRVLDDIPPAASSSEGGGDLDSSSSPPLEQKVIFATGGITNGRDALQMLNAGASVAMVYTGLVYGGAGTVTRIKEEMREELQKDKKR